MERRKEKTRLACNYIEELNQEERKSRRDTGREKERYECTEERCGRGGKRKPLSRCRRSEAGQGLPAFLSSHQRNESLSEEREKGKVENDKERKKQHVMKR